MWNETFQYSKRYSGCYPTSCLTFHWIIVYANLSQTIRSTEIETASTPFIVARVIRVFFFTLHDSFETIVKSENQTSSPLATRLFVARLQPGKNDDANRRGGVSEDCGHIRWTVRRSFKSLSCAYKSTSEHEHVTQVPWPIKCSE